MVLPFRWSVISFFSLFLFCSVAQADDFEFVRDFEISGSQWKIFRLDNLSARKTKSGYRFMLKENEVSQPDQLDLYLSFDQDINSLPNYQVIYSDFEKNKYQAAFGDSGGKFYQSKHYISLRPLSTSIFYPGKVPGSFTVEFWLYLYTKFDNQYVIRYIGNNPSDEFDKNDYGFSIFVRNNRLYYQFDNFFWSLQNEPFSIDVSEESDLTLQKWEHHAISFDIMRGKIATYKNGIEQTVKWVTSDGKILSPIYNPLVQGDLSTPILIGKNGFFTLDELRITRDTLSRFELDKFNNRPASLTTGVYRFAQNRGELRKILVDYNIPDLSHVKIAYRIHDRYFLADNTDIQWVYIQNGSDSFPPEYQSGKYIQFMIQVYPYEENQKEISLSRIKVQYVEDKTPDAPLLISVVPGDGSALISWIPSTEPDVTGYEIYYGTAKSNYICDHAANGESPVFYPYEHAGKLKAATFTLKGLRNEFPYFISLRSVDKNGNRSPFSAEMYVRPSTVANKSKYSVGY